MMKPIILLFTSLWMLVGNAHNEQYYMLHPKKMEKALEICSKNVEKTQNCEQLQVIAAKLNEKAYQLQIDPQAFGKKILALQQTIAQQETELQKKPNQIQLQTALNENKLLLKEHLILVRWLESPEG